MSRYCYCLAAEQQLLDLKAKFELEARLEADAAADATVRAMELKQNAHDLDHILSFVVPLAVLKEDCPEVAEYQELLLGAATVLPPPDALQTGTLLQQAMGHSVMGARRGARVAADIEYVKRFREKVHAVTWGLLLASAQRHRLALFLRWVSHTLDVTHLQLVIDRVMQRVCAVGEPPSANDAVVDGAEQFDRTFVQIIAVLKVTARTHSPLVAANALREHGNNLMANRLFPQAIQVYTEAIEGAVRWRATVEAALPQLLTNRAIAYIGLNCFAEAIGDLNRAVHYDLNFTAAWTQLGYCHLYMGSLLISLYCYLKALKTYVGYDEPDRAKRAAVLQVMMPQFVQTLVQSVVLSERRARQQHEDLHQVSYVVRQVKQITAELRLHVDAADRAYFDYDYQPFAREHTLRSMAERNNRAHPGILDLDTAQDILAGGGVEATAMPILVESRTRAPADEGSTSPALALLDRIQGLNSLISVIDQQLQQLPQQAPPQPQRSPPPPPQQQPPAVPAGPAAADTHNAPREGNVVRNALRDILPDYVAETFGNIIGTGARAMMHQGGEQRQRPDGNRGRLTNDTDMPEADID